MITVLSMVACLLAMASNWFAATRKMWLCYVLGAGAGVFYMALNIVIAMRGELGVALLVLPSAWLVITCMLGLYGLRPAITPKEEPCTK
jgi:hypothetical protein